MTAVSPFTMAAVRQSGAVPLADYLLSAEGLRKEFPGVVKGVIYVAAVVIDVHRQKRRAKH